MELNILDSGSSGNCEEIWKPINNMEDAYLISNYGRLRCIIRGKERTTCYKNKNGDYLRISFTYGNKKIYTSIHRLVAKTFLENKSELPCVNHIDGNKQNNFVGNLEWCTNKENIRHAIDTGLMKYNFPYKHSKYYKSICQYSLEGKFIKEYENATEAMKATGVCSRNILQVANQESYNKIGKIRKQAGGYVWKHTEKNQ